MERNRTRKIKPIICLLLATVLTISAISAALAAYETIRPGAKGDDVKRMQKKLLTIDGGKYKKDLGEHGADGKYGPMTVKAVRNFQRNRGLKVDGVAGNDTLMALYGGPASVTTDYGKYVTTAKDPTTLYFTSKGERVKQLQRALKALKYYTGEIDGSFGPGTHKAVMAFQKDKGLTQDGMAGKNTIAALNRAQKTSTISSTLLIAVGASGETIKRIQTRLSSLKYYDGDDSYGYYGQATAKAVREFQSYNNIKITGSIGQNTYNKLFSTTALKKGQKKYKSLSYGMTSADVANLNRMLFNIGFSYIDPTNNHFDDDTLKAVRAFQTNNPPLKVDGVAGQQTMTALVAAQ